MDESRKQFEAEMAKLGDSVDMRRAKNGDEEYMAWDVRLAWRFWNLSRTAIEIELPRIIDLYPFGPDSAKLICGFHKNAVAECASAIRAAGIKVKE